MNLLPAPDSLLPETLNMQALQALLISCRLDQQTLRRDTGADQDPSKDAGLSLLEVRMRRLVRRLESAAAAMDGIFQAGAAGSRFGLSEVLNREADLRIKNSLQLIASLLEKQARQSQIADTQAALQCANARINAVARVHASLQERIAPNGSVELGDYLATVCTETVRAFGAEERGIGLRIALHPLAVQPDTAQSIGIIVTELVTNAVRHGFPSAQEGTVRVTGEMEGSFYRLCVADDGVGLPQSGTTPLAPRMGLVLVNALAARVRASLQVDVTRGTRYTLTLPI